MYYVPIIHAQNFSLGENQRKKGRKKEADVLFWVFGNTLGADDPRAELLAGGEPHVQVLRYDGQGSGYDDSFIFVT